MMEASLQKEVATRNQTLVIPPQLRKSFKAAAVDFRCKHEHVSSHIANASTKCYPPLKKPF